MVAFLYRMPNGIRGDISRRQSTTVEPQLLNSALPFANYGMFGKIVSGKFVPLVASDTASVIYGILARPFPMTGSNASDPLGVDVPAVNGVADVVRRGYMTVVNVAGTPALGSQVYVRIANPSGIRVIGAIEAALVSGETVAVTGCTFAGTQDASGNVEIAYNI